ncbi:MULTISPECIES: 23S rRNA (uracil(1939)-C(5))-methyltransferase RlmD [Aerococcus]|uniref:23S rRNA (Uracil(1939)-C(5))-methyltransferase RlmD n=2 Tax=Aerococcus TaxID=1375 RepID=A0A178HBY5_9LACT|nr:MULTISPECIES: 23S rRNA (uracil(1939)-C(5))-methyltransferase RlmD [Aerococcus]KAA9217186.1 23S rRNA (uracil(1939)-C(5))-methyltransferase RlmD [Aerococcus loyolae]KAA9265516.1 23S rRNA (uracil(1939)-C(5))-methyltransferase RlmD [Aerococcus loyolae]MCY3026295.1 23S rRNA (uracil(1939)-C(5))-methyltransferase RlmD [Aerococcus loyolae]MCY3028175.1 23S rRNA (uracil(1939)-C(5))-methyltransferase RlmD [Aerococcus loyolae]MCY3028849.1 23S rRNA (uracil(1939)-C(5))-methyltransferase RlmD [Aerococcus 
MAKKKWQAPVKKNQILDVTIRDLTYEGMGVAKIDRYPLFIQNALVGEDCQVKVVKVLKKFAFAIVLKRYNDADSRVPLRDENGLRTGTMPLQHMAYPTQLDFKRQQVVNSLQKQGLLDQTQVLETIGMEEPWHYRNKAQIPIGQADGQLYTGFYRKGSHKLVPMTDYQIQLPGIDQTLQKVVTILNQYPISAYEEDSHQGLLRHLIVRQGYYTGQIMLVIVINGNKLPDEEEIIAALKAEIPDLVSIVINSNQKNTNVIMGQDQRVVYGEDLYEDRMFDLTFRISSKSFFQVNTSQAEKLYHQALKAADLKGDEVVVDAYCGIGTISLCLAQVAKEVYGVEVVPDAIDQARENAQLNGLDNVTFQAGKAEEVIQDWVQAGLKPDVVVVDPPRKGLAEDFIQSVLEVQPEKIVYVSCNPATLARDLAKFVDQGYQLGKVQPVDMFPQTHHVEAIVGLTRK